MAVTKVSGRAGLQSFAASGTVSLTLKDSDGAGSNVTPATGNRLIAAILLPGNTTGGTITAPAGWTEHKLQGQGSASPRVAVYSIEVTGGMTAGPYTWSCSGTSGAQGYMFEAIGVDHDTPMNGTATSVNESDTTTSLDPDLAALASLAVAGGLGVVAVGTNSSSGGFASPTNSYVEAYDQGRLGVFLKEFAGTTPVSFDATWTNAAKAAAVQVVFRPTVGVDPPTLPVQGSPATVARTAVIVLDLSGATDVDSVAWAQLSGPVDIASTIVTGSQPLILTYAYATVPGVYVFEATATGAGGVVQETYSYVVTGDTGRTRLVYVDGELH